MKGLPHPSRAGDNIQWYIAALAIAVSLCFVFLFYGAISDSQHAELDPDVHGPLGYGLWKLHCLCFYPDSTPTAERAPMYPLLIAGALAVTNGWWPHSVQLVQCLLFGATCVLVFWVAQALTNRSLAVLAAGLCAVYPLLIWYTSRIWVEILLMFLFTALIASVVFLMQRPTHARAALTGLIIGLGALTKVVFTPYLLLTPALLLLVRGRRVRVAHALTIVGVGVLIVTPWIVRNATVVGTYALTAGRDGFTFHQGNDVVQDFWKAPYSISGLNPLSIARIRAEDPEMRPDLDAMHQRIVRDAARRQHAIEKLERSPAFFLKKITYDAILFWTLGETKMKSLAIACLELPLVALFAVAVIRSIRSSRVPVMISAALILWYYLFHLPIIAYARYSVVLMPAMLALAVGVFEPRARSSQRSAVSTARDGESDGHHHLTSH